MNLNNHDFLKIYISFNFLKGNLCNLIKIYIKIIKIKKSQQPSLLSLRFKVDFHDSFLFSKAKMMNLKIHKIEIESRLNIQ